MTCTSTRAASTSGTPPPRSRWPEPTASTCPASTGARSCTTRRTLSCQISWYAGRQTPTSCSTPSGKRRMRSDYLLSQLDVLEAESIHIFREVAAEFERPALLFSGGKDSIVMLALAERAFRPAHIPFPVVHIDTGHNFSEVLSFRDRRVAELGVRLVVGSVQKSIDEGRAVEETGPGRGPTRVH